MASPPSTIYQGFAVANAHALITSKPAYVTGILVTNANAAARYFQLWDRTTDLSGGEVGTGPDPTYQTGGQLRVVSFIVPAGTAAAPGYLELNEDWFDGLDRFYTGLAWGFSSAAQTFTAGTAGDHTVTARWRAA